MMITTIIIEIEGHIMDERIHTTIGTLTLHQETEIGTINQIGTINMSVILMSAIPMTGELSKEIF